MSHRLDLYADSSIRYSDYRVEWRVVKSLKKTKYKVEKEVLRGDNSLLGFLITNNVGELLGLYEAILFGLRYKHLWNHLVQSNLQVNIWSDSKTALSWLEKGVIKASPYPLTGSLLERHFEKIKELSHFLRIHKMEEEWNPLFVSQPTRTFSLPVDYGHILDNINVFHWDKKIRKKENPADFNRK